MKNLFKKAHEMTRKFAKEYKVDYQAQFGLCLSFLFEAKEEKKMVELKGSEKQIKWAEDIRKEMIASIEREIKVVESIITSLIDKKAIERNKDEVKELKETIEEVKQIESAKFFIDNSAEKGTGVLVLLQNIKKAEKALEKIKKLKLAELKGSEKQVKWANKIRDEKLKRLAEIEDWRWNEYYYDYSKEEIIKVIATEIISAKTFIDTRYSLDSLVKEAIEMNK